MNGTIKNLNTMETFRGVAWSAELLMENGDTINIVNYGDGGSTVFRGSRETITKLNEWASRELRGEPEPLESIVCYTEEGESLLVGLERIRTES